MVTAIALSLLLGVPLIPEAETMSTRDHREFLAYMGWTEEFWQQHLKEIEAELERLRRTYSDEEVRRAIPAGD